MKKNIQGVETYAFWCVPVHSFRFRLSQFSQLSKVSAILQGALSITGDQEKALSILSKALAKGKAQPRDLLIRAIKATEAGQSKLLSEQERKLQGELFMYGHIVV